MQSTSVLWWLLRRSLQTLLVFVPLLVFAQPGNTIIAVGYMPRLPQKNVGGPGQILNSSIATAPGQVVDLFVAGVASKLSAPVHAAGFPLPTTLAGISVTLSRLPPGTGLPEPVSLLAVYPQSTCLNPGLPGAGTCGQYAVVTVQVPDDFVGSNAPSSGYLVVSENGAAGSSFEVFPWPDAVHVLTVTHAGGTLVTLDSPAKAGEVLIMWAFGLGQTTPPVPSGQPTPSPAPVAYLRFQLGFDYRPNVPPSRPYCATPLACPTVQPQFAGLTPGYAGLYQVNFVVPQPPMGTPACNDNSPGNVSNPSSVFSNLTVSLFFASLDGVGICVDPTKGS